MVKRKKYAAAHFVLFYCLKAQLTALGGSAFFISPHSKTSNPWNAVLTLTHKFLSEPEAEEMMAGKKET